MVVDAQAQVPLPDDVDFIQGAAATDAGTTSHATVITEGGVKSGDTVDVIRRGGTVVLVGMGKLESTINTKSLILNQCNLTCSNGGSKEDVAGIYEYMATGKLNPTITTIGFDEISDGIEKLKNGEVVGRLVAFYE